MSRHSGGTRDGTRSSALWGTGNRGGDSRANALWGKGGRGLLAILTVLFVTTIPLAQASRNPDPSTYLDPLLEAKAHDDPERTRQRHHPEQRRHLGRGERVPGGRER